MPGYSFYLHLIVLCRKINLHRDKVLYSILSFKQIFKLILGLDDRLRLDLMQWLPFLM